MIKIDLTSNQVAEIVSGTLVGDKNIRVKNLVSPDLASGESLCFVSSKQVLLSLKDNNIGLLIIPSDLLKFCASPRVIVKDIKIAMAALLNHIEPPRKPLSGAHPSAQIATSAEIAENVEIMAGVVIGERANIGKGTIIYSNVVIGDDVCIGESCVIYPSVVLYNRSAIGNRVILHGGVVLGADGYGYALGPRGHVKIPQLGNVVIEDDVEIGANSTIDRATLGSTKIGAGTKIDNLVMVGHNCVIGRGCILCGDVGIAGSVTVGDGVIFAGKAGVADHVTIGDRAVIGPCAAVGTDVPAGETFMGGSKAIPAQLFWRAQFQYERLPELARRVRRLEEEKSPKSLQVSGEKDLDRP